MYRCSMNTKESKTMTGVGDCQLCRLTIEPNTQECLCPFCRMTWSEGDDCCPFVTLRQPEVKTKSLETNDSCSTCSSGTDFVLPGNLNDVIDNVEKIIMDSHPPWYIWILDILMRLCWQRRYDPDADRSHTHTRDRHHRGHA